jgi:hypothetical protein
VEDSVQRVNQKKRTGADAVFIGWQKIPGGGFFPLYTITLEAHPLCGSTVSDRSLKRLDLRIPRTPVVRQIEKWLLIQGSARLRDLVRLVHRFCVPRRKRKGCIDHVSIMSAGEFTGCNNERREIC